MAILFGTWGVTTVATGLLLQLSEAARGYKTVLMVGDYLVLTYLCFWNTWLRNRLIQYSVRIRTEKHA